MIKIGIIIDDISKSAGTERAVSSLANGLLKFYPQDYTISILSIFSKEEKPIFFKINPKVEIIHLNKSNDFNAMTKFLWYRKLILDLKKLSITKEFQVLMGTTYIHNILLGFITKDLSISTIGCEHEVYDYPPKLIQQFRKLTYPKLNRLVVLNETEKHKYTFAKNSVIIPNSVPLTGTDVADLNAKRIISVGRLTYQKGFDMLIDVADRVHPKHPEWEFHIFGTGEDEEMLSQKIQEKKLEDIVILRGLSQTISEEYLNSSIFVLTSRWESFGLVLIEAMKLGIPVVSFDCDGPKSIVKTNENGFLVPKFDLDRMGAKISELIENNEMRNEMGKKSISLSEVYNEKNVMPLWNQLIQSII